MTSNLLAPPLPWRNPLVTSASPSGPNPTASTGTLQHPIAAPPRVRPLLASREHPHLLPAILVEAAARTRSTLGIVVLARGAANLRTGSEQLSGAEARTRSTLGVVVPACEALLSLRVRTGTELASLTGAGVKVAGIPGLNASLFGHTCYRSPVSQPGRVTSKSLRRSNSQSCSNPSKVECNRPRVIVYLGEPIL